MPIEFQPWPKIARLFRTIIITEKIDGTNGAIGIRSVEEVEDADKGCLWTDPDTAEGWVIYAQSRNRIITPDQDNFGFANWVYDHAPELILTLGSGLHFGEWWGSGIARGYGLPKGEKRFSLFNTLRYGDTDRFDLTRVDGLSTVPVLYEGPFSTMIVDAAVGSLRTTGSMAAPGFDNPEGVITFHAAANVAFKTTLKDDEKPKGQS